MKNPEPKTDWVGVGVNVAIFGLPSAAFVGSLFASSTHIKDWAMRHAMHGAGMWQGWMFALVVELIPVFGLLVLWKLRRVDGSLNVPRAIFAIGLCASISLQVAYVGGLTELSKVLVAVGPTLLALGATEVLLWLGRDEGKKDIPAPLVVLPPPPMVIPMSPLSNVPPESAAVPLDTTAAQQYVSPWTSPPTAQAVPPLVLQDNRADDPQDNRGEQGDNSQVTATVPPRVSPFAGREDMRGQDLPESGDSGAVSPTLSGGHVPQDMPEVDTVQVEDTSVQSGGTAGLDPIDLETWEWHQKGESKKELSTRYGVSEKTIQRRLGKVRAVIDTTETEEEHADA